MGSIMAGHGSPEAVPSRALGRLYPAGREAGGAGPAHTAPLPPLAAPPGIRGGRRGALASGLGPPPQKFLKRAQGVRVGFQRGFETSFKHLQRVRESGASNPSVETWSHFGSSR